MTETRLQRPCFFDQSPESLRDLFAQWGLPAFRARQVVQWVYEKHVADPAQMTNLSKRDRELLAERMRFTTGRVIKHLQASDGVQKLLLEWEGEAGDAQGQTECVMIPYEDRRTACISSQVGCPVGCRFCASGLDGLERNLSAGQIVEQAWRLGALPGVGRISNIVFMGMGEPLANFAAAAGAIAALHAEWGLGISGRRITLSTVGLPAQIRRLADADSLPPITLAISLHAPNDALRQQIIPWAERVSVAQLIDAGRYYFEKTGREVTLEYTLLGGVNDQAEHARELAQVAKTLRCNVNLIRYNEVDALPFKRPADADVTRFQQLLRQHGVNAHIRASRGRDIKAACGQLRHEHKHVPLSRDGQPVG